MVNEVLNYSPQVEMLRVPLIVRFNHQTLQRTLTFIFSPVSIWRLAMLLTCVVAIQIIKTHGQT